MKVKRITKWAIGGAMGALMLFGGAVSAADYPPADSTAPAVAVGGVSGLATPAASVSGELPATGADSSTTLKLAGGVAVAGAGLLVAAKLRRRPAIAV